MTTSHGTPGAGDGVERSPVQARQAVTTGRMRWVLRISLALCVVALGGLFLVYVSVGRHPGRTDTAAPPAASSTANYSGVR